MDTLIGIAGKDFVLIACDQTVGYHHLRLAHGYDKILEIDSNKLLGFAGNLGDSHQFGEYVRKNVHLYRYINSSVLGTHATANFTRNELAYSLRKSPLEIDILLAGVDKDGPNLYWIDYLASMVNIKKGAQGPGASLVYGILDDLYREDLTEEDALNIINLCAAELKKRFIIAHYDFLIKVIDKNGLRQLKISI
ncbi:putative proteasome subunit beta type 2 [Cardiosporidium cionae]|uniref:Proteasome subunit beta n=1 Tax=Cardiosporidium cionae TaxID=476202 RepID=A0ABQ7JE55_9APIC|nr:putative proteasome subunit beta type 2 [Cardiosporidium cionae]|eukprot:KAF8822287.1 putative proteasome subunit beta type 2 [Cardiosporidium cionae]